MDCEKMMGGMGPCPRILLPVCVCLCRLFGLECSSGCGDGVVFCGRTTFVSRLSSCLLLFAPATARLREVPSLSFLPIFFL